MVSFKTSKNDGKLIAKIAARASAYALSFGIEYPVQDAAMDITAVHANGNPLRLSDLLTADEFNFAHDVLGIRKRLDRSTGKLTDCWSPRSSAPSERK